MPTAPIRRIKDNWILSYSDTIKKFSEAPDSYNVWSAVSVISAVLKNKVWINRGIYKVFPNQYIVLVGPPGVGKGTAIHPAHDFVRNHKPSSLANYISDRVTAPRIIELLSKGFQTTVIRGGLPVPATESTAILMSSELQTLLSSSDWMMTFLCDAWDRGTYDYDTKNKGTHLITGMCVSLIGACVPDFVRQINKDVGAAINGGFTARALFIFAVDKSKSLAWPVSFKDDPTTKQIYDDLEHDLTLISNMSGEFSFTMEAKILWERKYHSIKVEEEDSNVVRHFKGRQGTHIMKLAMCFSAAKDDSLIIDDYAMRVAIQMVQNVLDTLDITFRGVGESPLAEATAKVQAIIERKGLATRTEIYKLVYRSVTSEDLDRILWTLLSIDFMEETTVGNKRMYKHTNAKGVVPSTINVSIP